VAAVGGMPEAGTATHYEVPETVYSVVSCAEEETRGCVEDLLGGS
jgi:hypothetical protein